MAGYYAQVTMLALSGDTADNEVNGFAFIDPGLPDLAEMTSLTTAIKDFYDDVYGLNGLRGLAQNGHLVKIYDILGARPNYPIYEFNFNLAVAPGAVDLPLELTLAVSYKNTVLNSVPRARRRGRIYLSGWTESMNTAGRPTLTAYQGLADAYTLYAQTVNGIGTLEAGVWSRTDGVVYPIDTVWCDNEWDTQRRRGTKPTARDTNLI